jgi:hypothetical protein
MPASEVKTEDMKENDSKQANSGDKKKPQNNALKAMFAKQVKRKAEDEAKGIVKKPKAVTKRCKTCRQLEDDNFMIWFEAPPQGAQDELSVLFNPDNNLIIESTSFEDRPVIGLDRFDVYDDEGHLAPLNTGLLETGAKLKFCGYLKPLLDTEKEGAPVKDCSTLLVAFWF